MHGSVSKPERTAGVIRTGSLKAMCVCKQLKQDVTSSAPISRQCQSHAHLTAMEQDTDLC